MSAMQSCDVAVIGAGPAGATAAFLLARHGYDVVLFDRHDFPRPKPCAGLLTWKSIDLLERLFGLSLARLSQKGLILHSCWNYRIYYKIKEIGGGRLDFPFHFIDRTVYDHYWLRTAGAVGARTIMGVAVTSVDAQTGRLTLANGLTFAARVIIGADGIWSKARRSLPGREDRERRWRVNLAGTIELRRPYGQKATSDVAALHFGYLPWGYAWSFPGSNSQTLGIAGLRMSRDRSIRKAFSNFLEDQGVDSETATHWQSYPLPYGNFLCQPASRRLLLAGDACGLADPLLGEGIYYAHASAAMAAKAIIETNLAVERVGRRYGELLGRGLLHELRWINFWRTLLFMGGAHRRYRGLRLFCRIMPKRLEAAVHGQLSFSRLLLR